MNTKVEIIIPQSVLRYFYRDDDIRMEIEDKIRSKNIASLPKSFTTCPDPSCPALKIKFKFVRSWNFKKHFDQLIIDGMPDDARGAYAFSFQIDDQEMPKTDFSYVTSNELTLIIMVQPKIQAFLLALQLAIPGFVDFEAKDILTTAKEPITQHMLQHLFTSMKSDMSMCK